MKRNPMRMETTAAENVPKLQAFLDIGESLSRNFFSPGPSVLCSEMLAEADEDSLPRWLTELNSLHLGDRRKTLLLEVVGEYARIHGFDGRLARWAVTLSQDAQADPTLRTGALHALAKSRPEALVQEWIKGLYNQDIEVQRGAIRLLALSRSPLALRPLTQLLLDADPRLSQLLLHAITEIGTYDPIVESILLDFLKRRWCVPDLCRCLGAVGGPESLGPLLSVFSRSEDEGVLLSVARVSERVGDGLSSDSSKHHCAQLKRWLSHTSVEVRALSFLSLVRLGVAPSSLQTFTAFDKKQGFQHD